MRRTTMRSRWLAFLVVGLLLGADARKVDKQDKDSVEGTWSVVSAEREGKPFTEQIKNDTITFKDGSVTIKKQNGEEKGTYKLNADRKPKEIDITISEGPQKGKVIQGIFER